MTGLLDYLASTPAMSAIWSDTARLQGMLDFEAALAAAEAGLGIIPVAAATPIRDACRAELYDIDAIASEAGRAGNLTIPVVRALTARVAATDPAAARSVHWGATSQDAQDTGTMRQAQRGSALLLDRLEKLADHLAALAGRTADTVLPGRTWLQHALPVTFGLKAASWLGGIAAARAGLARAADRAAVLQFGGAAGTLASLGERGPDVAAAMATLLDLAVPPMPWHTERTRVAGLGAALGIVCGAAGKIARDLALLGQTEVGEAFEPTAPGKGGSSTMPHKRNPVGCAVALAAAMEAPPLVATLLAAMVQEHERGLGGWHAEWETLPKLFRRAAAAVDAMEETIGGLELDATRMRANLDETRGLLLAEAVSMALATHLGKADAHALVERASRAAVADGVELGAALRAMPDVMAHLDEGALAALLRPENYLGASRHFVEQAIKGARPFAGPGQSPGL